MRALISSVQESQAAGRAHLQLGSRGRTRWATGEPRLVVAANNGQRFSLSAQLLSSLLALKVARFRQTSPCISRTTLSRASRVARRRFKLSLALSKALELLTGPGHAEASRYIERERAVAERERGRDESTNEEGWPVDGAVRGGLRAPAERSRVRCRLVKEERKRTDGAQRGNSGAESRNSCSNAAARSSNASSHTLHRPDASLAPRA